MSSREAQHTPHGTASVVCVIGVASSAKERPDRQDDRGRRSSVRRSRIRSRPPPPPEPAGTVRFGDRPADPADGGGCGSRRLGWRPRFETVGVDRHGSVWGMGRTAAALDVLFRFLGGSLADPDADRLIQVRFGQRVGGLGTSLKIIRHREKSLLRGCSVDRIGHPSETCSFLAEKLRGHRQFFQVRGDPSWQPKALSGSRMSMGIHGMCGCWTPSTSSRVAIGYEGERPDHRRQRSGDCAADRRRGPVTSRHW